MLDAYMEAYRARGVSAQVIASTEARLNKWGRWLKGRRPRIAIEQIDAEMHTLYIAKCTSFRSKATVLAVVRHIVCKGGKRKRAAETPKVI